MFCVYPNVRGCTGTRYVNLGPYLVRAFVKHLSLPGCSFCDIFSCACRQPQTHEYIRHVVTSSSWNKSKIRVNKSDALLKCVLMNLQRACKQLFCFLVRAKACYQYEVISDFWTCRDFWTNRLNNFQSPLASDSFPQLRLF